MKQAARNRHDRSESEIRQLRQMLDSTAVPTFAVDADSTLILWNRACELLTGRPAAEMIGTRRHQQVFYEVPRPVMADLLVQGAGIDELTAHYGENFRRSALVETGFEGMGFFPGLGSQGKWIFFTAVPIKNADEQVTGAIETLQDITELRLVEKRLQDSEARYRLLFESANDAIFLLKDGIVSDCNHKSLALFTCTREEMIGKSPLDFSPKHQADGALSDQAVENKRRDVISDVPQLFEWRFHKKNGTLFDAEVSVTRFQIAGTPHAIAIVRDITDHKRLVQTLKKREKELDEKSRYLEKVNQALKASLDYREIEKRSVEETLLVNLKRFVLPYLEALSECKMSPDAGAYLSILETNLNELVSQFSRTLFSTYQNLTPTEIRIADLIRNGKNTKEIAAMLGLSPSSVQWHRKNIRAKLQLTHKKTNLRTYLSSLSE